MLVGVFYEAFSSREDPRCTPELNLWYYTYLQTPLQNLYPGRDIMGSLSVTIVSIDGNKKPQTGPEIDWIEALVYHYRCLAVGIAKAPRKVGRTNWGEMAADAQTSAKSWLDITYAVKTCLVDTGLLYGYTYL